MADTTTWQRDLSVDLQVALRTSATRPADEFTGIYGSETIERFLHASYDQFASRSTVANFLPLLAERRVRHLLDELGVAAR